MNMKKLSISLFVIMLLVAGTALAAITIHPQNKGVSNLCYKDADSKWKCVDPVETSGGECTKYVTKKTNCRYVAGWWHQKFCDWEEVCVEYAPATSGFAMPDGTVEYGLTHLKRLQVCVDLTGLEAKKKYQLTLNGEISENGCTLTSNDYRAYINNVLSTASTDPYTAGCWDNKEGWYNFKMGVRANKFGEINRCYNVNLPYGMYKGIKFLVKKDGRPTSIGGNGDGDYQAVLMEETKDDMLEFNIGEKFWGDYDPKGKTECTTFGLATVC